VLPSCNQPDEACSPVRFQIAGHGFYLAAKSFQLDGGDMETIEGLESIIFLPYWMARYYGVIASGDSVVSAATGSSTVSPESWRLQWVHLATDTAQPDSLPLPPYAAGISVQVTDSAGAYACGAMSNVSPTADQFSSSAGTALGQASSPLPQQQCCVATSTPMCRESRRDYYADSTGKA